MEPSPSPRSSSKSEQLVQLRQLNDAKKFSLRSVFSAAGSATRAVHADDHTELCADHAPPIHVATTFHLDERPGSEYVYGRSGTPTRDRVERVLEAVEGIGNNVKAATFSSGMAALTCILNVLNPDLLLVFNAGYTGALKMLRDKSDVFGVIDDAAQFETLAPSRNRCVIFCEAVRNPDSTLCDFESLNRIAKATRATVVCDATFSTPVLCKPLVLGAHVVLHSASKFLGGHSDLLCGVLCTPDVRIFMRIMSERMHAGSVLGSLESFLLLRSLRTLTLRVKRQSKNAFLVAQFLQRHPMIDSISNGAMDQPKLWKTFVAESSVLETKPAKLACPCFTFRCKDAEEAVALPAHLRLISNCTSLGGVSTSIDHRHRWDPKRDPRDYRISIGVEDAKDIIEDLEQAFAKIAEQKKKN